MEATIASLLAFECLVETVSSFYAVILKARPALSLWTRWRACDVIDLAIYSFRFTAFVFIMIV